MFYVSMKADLPKEAPRSLTEIRTLVGLGIEHHFVVSFLPSVNGGCSAYPDGAVVDAAYAKSAADDAFTQRALNVPFDELVAKTTKYHLRAPQDIMMGSIKTIGVSTSLVCCQVYKAESYQLDRVLIIVQSIDGSGVKEIVEKMMCYRDFYFEFQEPCYKLLKPTRKKRA